MAELEDLKYKEIMPSVNGGGEFFATITDPRSNKVKTISANTYEEWKKRIDAFLSATRSTRFNRVHAIRLEPSGQAIGDITSVEGQEVRFEGSKHYLLGFSGRGPQFFHFTESDIETLNDLQAKAAAANRAYTAELARLKTVLRPVVAEDILVQLQPSEATL